MNLLRKNLITVLIILIIILVEFGYNISTNICENKLISSVKSPDEQWKVVLFERNCGATTGFSSQISLLKFEQALGSDPGNIYIADGYPDDYSIHWTTNYSVVVKGKKSRNFKKITQFDGIKFKYE